MQGMVANATASYAPDTLPPSTTTLATDNPQPRPLPSSLRDAGLLQGMLANATASYAPDVQGPSRVYHLYERGTPVFLRCKLKNMQGMVANATASYAPDTLPPSSTTLNTDNPQPRPSARHLPPSLRDAVAAVSSSGNVSERDGELRARRAGS